MRIVSFLVVLFMSSSTLYAQGNNWSKGATKTEYSFVNSINVNKNEAVYFGGNFKDTVQNEDFYFETLPGKNKILCGKYKNDGTLIWAAADGECNFIYANSTAYDKAGNLYIGGSCIGDITFNGITYPNKVSAFLTKFDNQGSPQWIKLIKGLYDEYSSGIASIKIDSENNIYAWGSFCGQIDFGDTIISGLPKPFSNAALLKYDPSGNFLWARSYIPRGVDLPVTNSQSMMIDENDNIYVSGELAGTLRINSTTSIASVGQDIFIHKIDKNGNSRWLIKIGNPNVSEIGRLGALRDGAFYYAMLFQGDSIIINDKTYRGVKNSYNVVTGNVLIKCDTSGNVQWSKLIALPIQNTGAISKWEVDLDKAGNIIASGTYEGSVDFIDTTLISKGDDDPFILRLNPAGNLMEVWSEGCERREFLSSMGLDSCGNYYLAGMFEDSTSLGDIPLKTKAGKISHFITRITTNNECGLVLGTAERDASVSNVVIFPNPAYNNEAVQIETGEFLSGRINISLKDMLGNKVYEQTFSGNKDSSLKIETGNLISGTYFVEISDEKKSMVKKLVVVK